MSTRSCVSGPAMSSRPFSGGALATSASAAATSSCAIGCTSSGAMVAVPSRSVQLATMAAKSWNWVARTMLHGTGPPVTRRSCSRLPA